MNRLDWDICLSRSGSAASATGLQARGRCGGAVAAGETARRAGQWGRCGGRHWHGRNPLGSKDKKDSPPVSRSQQCGGAV